MHMHTYTCIGATYTYTCIGELIEGWATLKLSGQPDAIDTRARLDTARRQEFVKHWDRQARTDKLEQQRLHPPPPPPVKAREEEPTPRVPTSAARPPSAPDPATTPGEGVGGW